jgi:hypothetical protein
MVLFIRFGAARAFHYTDGSDPNTRIDFARPPTAARLRVCASVSSTGSDFGRVRRRVAHT